MNIKKLSLSKLILAVLLPVAAFVSVESVQASVLTPPVTPTPVMCGIGKFETKTGKCKNGKIMAVEYTCVRGAKIVARGTMTTGQCESKASLKKLVENTCKFSCRR